MRLCRSLLLGVNCWHMLISFYRMGSSLSGRYITSKAPPPLPTLTPTSKARPGPLDTDNPYFSRNLALVLVSIGLTLVLFILSIWIIIIRRRRRKLGIHANGIIDKSNIRLAMTPTSDTSWMLRKSYTSSAQAPSINNTEDSSSIIKTPNSAAFLIRHSRKDSFSKSTTIPDRTYSPSSLSSSATTKQIPRDFLIRNPEISAATPQRPKFVLPTFNLDLLTSTNTTNTRGPSSRVTMTSLESISHNFPATSASSVLEHDGIISITPRMSLDGNDDDDDETRSQGPQSPRSSVLWRSHHRMVRDCSETAPSRGR